MKLCRAPGIRQSVGRVGFCLDSAAAESFLPTLEHEVLSGRRFATEADAHQVIDAWCYEHSQPVGVHREPLALPGSPDRSERQLDAGAGAVPAARS